MQLSHIQWPPLPLLKHYTSGTVYLIMFRLKGWWTQCEESTAKSMGFKLCFLWRPHVCFRYQPPQVCSVYYVLLYYDVRILCSLIVTSWIALNCHFHNTRGPKSFLTGKCHQRPLQNYNAMYIHRASWQSTSFRIGKCNQLLYIFLHWRVVCGIQLQWCVEQAIRYDSVLLGYLGIYMIQI